MTEVLREKERVLSGESHCCFYDKTGAEKVLMTVPPETEYRRRS